jgi:hypothetical protein
MEGVRGASTGISLFGRRRGVLRRPCYDSTEQVVTRKSGMAPSFGFEAAIYGADGAFRAGAAFRAEFAGSVSLFTLGPVLGSNSESPMDADILLALESPPAIYAPAADLDRRRAKTATRPRREKAPPGVAFPRIQCGGGAGSSGLAFACALGVDFWPLRQLGIGLEGVRGGSSSFTRFGETENDSLEAARLRIAGRVKVHTGVFAVAALLGPVLGLEF